MEVIRDAPDDELHVVIRLCTKQDLAALHTAMPSPFHEDRFQTQEKGKASYLIAWHHGTPVGHLNLKWEGDDQAEVRERLPDTPELNAIGVWPPELRSRGVGRKLIEAAESMAKAVGSKRVGLGVEVTNERARRLYERLGYRDWRFGIYVDRWTEVDEQGNKTLYQARCNYLTKFLT